jgi:acetylornithine/N-succinyldiaminopimelate aminotransferase
MSGLMPTYRRYPIRLVRGEGLTVWDDRGRAYLDFAGGIAAVPIGHAHPAWVAAVTGQASTLVHVSNLFHTGPQEEVAERLSGITELSGGVFLSNSGAEANEAALKIIRRWGRPQGRTKVVALEGSFHGRTFATLAATGQPEKWEQFAPLPEGFIHVRPGDLSSMSVAVNDRAAAVLLEPVLGEGGVVPLDPDYLQGVRRLCDERGALLVLDEVQTGVGRTGAWYAFQRMGVIPDVLTSAKALAGGLPIGATLVARDELAFAAGEHASTFGGGPVPCAAALAVLKVIEDEGLLANAASQGGRLLQSLTAAVGGAGLDDRPRGLGLLIGVPVGAGKARDVVMALLGKGFLATEAGPDVVRVTPPLTVDADSVDRFCEAFAEALAESRPVEGARR